MILLYNSQDNAIGFIFTNSESAGVFKITHSKSKTSASIVARSFFTNFKLDQKLPELVGKYVPSPVDDPNLDDVKKFFIKLDEKK